MADLYGGRACKRAGHKENRGKGNLGKPGFYVAVYSRGDNVGVLEDTLMIEMEARERFGLQRESNRAAAANTSCNPPIGAKSRGGLRGVLHGQRMASPTSWEDVKLDTKPRVDTADGLGTRIETGSTRDPGMGGLMSDLDLEVKDEAQMDELGKATDEIMAAQVETLAG
jgi:hypothetical protein